MKSKISEYIAAGKILHTEGYLSHEDLYSLIQSSLIVCLPYTPNFQGSSGVLNDAVKCSTKVLTTSHGLIGHRVVKYWLGETFEYDDIHGLKTALLRIASSNSPSDQEVMMRTKYRDEFSVNRFLDVIRKDVGNA